MFCMCPIDDSFLYNDLIDSVKFEEISKGRLGAVIADLNNDIIPLVRTTTKYNNPIQSFNNIHYKLIENIKNIFESTFDSKFNIKFNNALIEIYDSKYKNMGLHTDQSLDLQEDSDICIYSCYDDLKNSRTLNIINRHTGDKSEILLENNSVVLFSLETNKNFLHQIVFNNNSKNNWLGITFRLSKTFIHFVNDIPYFYGSDRILKLANHQETQEFYEQRKKENTNIDFVWNKLDYTISKSDLLNFK